MSRTPKPFAEPAPTRRLPSSRARRLTGRTLLGLLAAVVIGLPIVAGVLDSSADRVADFSVPLWIGWGACAVLVPIVLTHVFELSGSDATPGLALAYDGLPLLLAGAWVLLAASVSTRHWLLALTAGGLCVYHLTLLVPRFVADPVPRWARNAPRVTICVANVYIDNPTPDLAAKALAQCGADLIVIVESNPAFIEAFDREGGLTAFPNRVTDPDDHSDYAVTIASRLALLGGSEVKETDVLRSATAVVAVGSRELTIIGLNAMATVEPGGYHMWGRQIRELTALIPTSDGPLVIAGDLNATGYRPEFRALLRAGLRDAHDSLGKGLNPSFKLSASGPLAMGPVVRLDHVLIGHGVAALEVANLAPNGSDHLPFLATLAVQQLPGIPRLRRPKRRSTARLRSTGHRLRLRSRARSRKRRRNR